MRAGVYSYTFNSGLNNGGVIPDASSSGWTDTRTLGITDGGIISVSVTLNLSGGYNGDLYGYLVHSSGFTVLLDRVGSPANSGFGYSNPGFGPTAGNQAFTLSDSGGYDIHNYQDNSPVYNASGQLTGTWRPDNSSFTSFSGLDASGTWTLFFADRSGGDVSTVVSWGLEITTVPEPVTWALWIFGGVLLAARYGRRLLRWRPT